MCLTIKVSRQEVPPMAELNASASTVNGLDASACCSSGVKQNLNLSLSKDDWQS